MIDFGDESALDDARRILEEVLIDCPGQEEDCGKDLAIGIWIGHDLGPNLQWKLRYCGVLLQFPLRHPDSLGLYYKIRS